MKETYTDFSHANEYSCSDGRNGEGRKLASLSMGSELSSRIMVVKTASFQMLKLSSQN
jgi:hypothetical protein